MSKNKKWEIILEDSVHNSVMNENIGIISNGEQFLFFRVGENLVCRVYVRLSYFLSGYQNFSYQWNAENDESLLAILNDEQADIDARREMNERNGIETLPKDEAWFIPRIVKRGACLGARRDLLTRGAFEQFSARCKEHGVTGPDFVKATRALLETIRDMHAILEPTIADEFRELIVPENLIVLSPDKSSLEKVCVCEDKDGFLVSESYDGLEQEADAPDFGYLFYYAWVLYCANLNIIFNRSEGVPDALNDILLGIIGKPEGTLCVKAMNAFLREKRRKSVEFEEDTYGNQDDIPVCRETGTKIQEISLPSDGSYLSVVITVADPEDETQSIQKEFTGWEDEDFEQIFNEVYDYIKDVEDPDADEFLEQFLIVPQYDLPW